MKGALEKFLDLVKRTGGETDPDKSWKARAEWRRANRGWLRVSGRIAVAVLDAMEKSGTDRESLREAAGLSGEQMERILSGREDFTVDTIRRLEAVLGTAIVRT